MIVAEKPAATAQTDGWPNFSVLFGFFLARLPFKIYFSFLLAIKSNF
jgi:hypothetical protein